MEPKWYPNGAKLVATKTTMLHMLYMLHMLELLYIYRNQLSTTTNKQHTAHNKCEFVLTALSLSTALPVLFGNTGF